MNTIDSETISQRTDEHSDNEFRQYRAPRSNGETFVDPPWADSAKLMQANRQLLASHGSAWDAMRREARQRLVSDAVRYTRAYRDVNWVDHDPDRPIIMAGHQPSLFHPGVWFKNFALSDLGSRLGATALNLVVDNDVAKSSSIRVPTIDSASGLATVNTVAYDDFGGGVPYEQTTVGNLALFDQFDTGVKQAVAPLVKDPCVTQLWPHARRAIERCGIAGCALAQARHGLEADIGLQTLEIPLGVVCRGREFADFALSILTELPRFRNCYNDSVAVYRAAHGIRSSAHPVPDLGQQGEWFEAPLWIYGNQSPGRKAAWVRMTNDGLEISDLGNRSIRIQTGNRSDAIDQLSAAMTPEFKIRPRALMTTMYSRLVLSDLFLHGIGGGKYDQLSDQVMRAFFAVEPPDFMVLSATVHLPGTEQSDVQQRIRALKRRIRETHFQGERFAETQSGNETLVESKRELLRRVPPRGQRPQWHQEITSINRRLSDELVDVRSRLTSELVAAHRELASQSVLESREHSFCVYPLDYLTETFNGFLT